MACTSVPAEMQQQHYHHGYQPTRYVSCSPPPFRLNSGTAGAGFAYEYSCHYLNITAAAAAGGPQTHRQDLTAATTTRIESNKTLSAPHIIIIGNSYLSRALTRTRATRQTLRTIKHEVVINPTNPTTLMLNLTRRHLDYC